MWKKSKGYDKDIKDLITLCHKCHYNRHDRSEKIDNLNSGGRHKINIERDLEIRKMRSERYTLRAVGEKYGITRERVRQICL